MRWESIYRSVTEGPVALRFWPVNHQNWPMSFWPCSHSTTHIFRVRYKELKINAHTKYNTCLVKFIVKKWVEKPVPWNNAFAIMQNVLYMKNRLVNVLNMFDCLHVFDVSLETSCFCPVSFFQGNQTVFFSIHWSSRRLTLGREDMFTTFFPLFCSPFDLSGKFCCP